MSRVVVCCLVAVVGCAGATGCAGGTPTATPTSAVGSASAGGSSPTSAGSPSVASPADGVPAWLLNPAVTQATIAATICVSGWTATVRPPAAYTTGLKRRQLVASGVADQNLADYEEDHRIPLELGGAPYNPGPHTVDSASLTGNLWPEPIGPAHTKDVAENAGHAAVCSGRESLAAARLEMFTKWGPGR